MRWHKFIRIMRQCVFARGDIFFVGPEIRRRSHIWGCRQDVFVEVFSRINFKYGAAWNYDFDIVSRKYAMPINRSSQRCSAYHLILAYFFFETTACPPNSRRRAASTRSVKGSCCRERKRRISERVMTSAGTPVSTACCTVQRPSPESCT